MPSRKRISLTVATLLVAGVLGGPPSQAHAGAGSCAQPLSSGASPVASDCLFILKAAVGSATCTKPCICSPKGNTPPRASDALLCLYKSVGTPTALDCPCGVPDYQATKYEFDPATDIPDPLIRSRYVATDYLGAFSQDQDASVADWTAGWTVELHGNHTIWHPASGGTLNGAEPSADGVCPPGTTDTGDTALPAGFTGTMDVCQLPARELGDLTLTNDNVYRTASSASAGTLIGDGDAPGSTEASVTNASLTVEPGTLILGDVGENLIVTRGSKVFINGTKNDPVSMNSLQQWNDWLSGGTGEGDRRSWGGFVVTGFATANFCNNPITCDATIEGISLPIYYGGTNDADNSGVITYLEVSNPGYEIPPVGSGNDLNGITLYTVGYPTIISYVQSNHSGDDAFEMFGGKVVVDHAVATGAQDDNLDSDVGYLGGYQFVVVKQFSDKGDKGIESDNGPATQAYQGLTPVSRPNYVNTTILNAANAVSDNPVSLGMRTWTGINAWNGLATGAERAAIRTENGSLTQRAGVLSDPDDGLMTIHNWAINSTGSTNGDFNGSAPDNDTDLGTWYFADPNNRSIASGLGLNDFGFPPQVP
ncbi:MAG: hypothetical protein HY899_15550 [Deltaproteobacteria bacterium]|nr:hypothetical protein [Deltaproteobacteria bacterium]